MAPSPTAITAAQNLLSFIDHSPTPFHAVENIRASLNTRCGFEVLSERDRWKLEPGRGYVVIRGGSTIAAFLVGSKKPDETGFRIVGAHTDSPNLRLKPNALYEKNGYVQLGVEPYGGVLLNSWLNRDLSLAGRLFTRSEKGLAQHLVLSRKVLASNFQLAIHLNRGVNESGLVVNKQTHLPPIVGLVDTSFESAKRFEKILRDTAEIPGDEKIVGTELMLYDTQKGGFAGFSDEFINVARLDNLASCHAGSVALMTAARNSPKATCILVCYDNEEVSSVSAQGAYSTFLPDVLERIVCATRRTAGTEQYRRAIARSFCISADMAHGIHPNYPDKHEARHAPVLGGGPVIKTNVDQKYATTAETAMVFKELCRTAGVPSQEFVIRSDLPCGSTIGPITAAMVGIPTVDVGNPMLSMHAIREQAATADHEMMVNVLTELFGTENLTLL